MQVFLPYADFEKSVAALDKTRLGNQIYRECKTLISGGWPNHPASKIWSNHRHALAKYSLVGLRELTNRGRHYPEWYTFFTKILNETEDTGNPPLVGMEYFHASHRSNLLRKVEDAKLIAEQYTKIGHPRARIKVKVAQNMEQWYSRFQWNEPTTLEYVWNMR